MSNIRLHNIEAFIDADCEVVRFYPEGADIGAPCVQVAMEDLAAWAYAFTRFAGDRDFDEYGDEPVGLPGMFGKLTEADADEAGGPTP